MYYIAKEIKLKNGDTIILRSAKDSDAIALIDYLYTVSSETDFLIRTPTECKLKESEERMFIRRSLRDEHGYFLICELNKQIVGTCSLRMNAMQKTKHRAEVGIAIIKDAWNLGIGTIMFNELIDLARKHGVEQLELDFIDGNARAEALYTKMGFVRVARKPNAIRQLNGQFVDEIFMVRKL